MRERDTWTVFGDRGQAHTLEGVVAALLLLSSLVFALQSTAVTPLSASTSSQHIENQQKAVASGVLAAAKEDGSLRAAVLYWDTDKGQFHGTQGSYTNDADFPPTDNSTTNLAFADTLIETFSQRGIAYNVYFVHQTDSGDAKRREFIYRGAPSDNAVTASRVVTIYDDSPLYKADAKQYSDGRTVTDASSFYANDVSTDTNIYNVVRVEVVVWRM